MYPQGYPYPPVAPPPRRPGPSPLVIVLIVLGVMMVLGGGACLFLGGLLALGASAEPAPEPPAATPQGTTTSQGVSGSTGDPADPPAAAGTIPADPGAAATAPAAPKATAPAPKAITPMWFCNATGFVRVCGFANVCNNINVFGSGTSPDRFLAQQQAKMNCEGMARARGGSAICAVSCSVATH